MEAVLKTARVEVKTTPELKEMIAMAAALSGMDTSSFLMLDAAPRARKVLMEHSVVHLSMESQRRFAELNQRRGEPNEAMKKLAALPDLPERDA